MQMIDVIKRLAELDSTNPNVAKPAMTQEQSLATVTNIEGETITESIAECGPMGMMGGMDRPTTPASFSINASAASGDEVSSMLRDIMNLAGVKPVADLPAFTNPIASKEIELEPAHSAEPVDDMADMIGMIDSMNGPSSDEPSSDAVGHGTDMGANPVADMADEVRDMTDELVSTAGGDKIEDEGYANSPDPQVKAHSYGDDQVTIGKAKSDPFTGPGNNNLKKQTESADPFEQVSLQLLKAYAEFKNQK